MPRSCAISALVLPVAGITSSRSNAPGMRRAPISAALGDMNHDYFSSVILLDVHTASIAVLELEDDAAWSIHMDRIAPGLEASQRCGSLPLPACGEKVG